MQNKQSGQVLLIVVLLATVLLTIGLSASRITTEETKIARLEEDSKRALSAAEAGLEAALQKASGTVSIGPLLGGDAGVTGTATITSVQSPTFTTPLLHKDEQYTFYLSDYTPKDPEDTGSQQQFGSAFAGTFSIQRQQPRGDYCSGTDKFAVEATIIDAITGEIMTRKLIDECTPATVEGTTDKVSFGDVVDLASTPGHLLILRVLASNSNFSGTVLEVKNEASPSQNWPAQGKTIVSEATTSTEVTKKIELFQSYPQIPTELFVVSF